MPYKRSSNKRMRKYYRPGYKACGQMVLSDAQRALYKVNNLKKLLNVEYKHHNISTNSTAITDAGLITPLTNLAEGDTSTTRDGGSVKWTSFQLAYDWTINASATVTRVRLMIVQDKQTNQAVFTIPDLLFDGTIVDNIYSPYNINNASRFNILYDKVHVLTINGSNRSVYRKIHRKLRLKTRYDAAVGDITDLTQDSLALVMIADQTTNDPILRFGYRGRFIDN